jgi:hypothetical protein
MNTTSKSKTVFFGGILLTALLDGLMRFIQKLAMHYQARTGSSPKVVGARKAILITKMIFGPLIYLAEKYLLLLIFKLIVKNRAPK